MKTQRLHVRKVQFFTYEIETNAETQEQIKREFYNMTDAELSAAVVEEHMEEWTINEIEELYYAS